MAKGRTTRDTSIDEICNEMREQRGNVRKKEISKLLSRPRVMKKAYESEHQKPDLENQDKHGRSS